MMRDIIVSFVHLYKDLDLQISEETLPALWVHSATDAKVHNYPFPCNISDFHKHSDLIVGEMPLPGSSDFKRLPRFGFTGLSQTNSHIYAGSWNAVYQIRKSDFALEAIITNSLMNDMHGIHVDNQFIVTALTGKDAIVFSDFDGRIVDHFTVGRDLSIYKDESIDAIDWRFISKQFRGATGIWHFNYIQRFGDELWLTSRNINAFIVVNTKTRKAHVRSINHKSPVLLHDGRRHNGAFYFTSIDGKIIIAAEAETADFNPREDFDGIQNFSRDLVCKLLRLSETEFGREPNWCRGLAVNGEAMYTTVDGRYDEDLSFGLLGITPEGKKVLERRLRWDTIGDPGKLRAVTGFDVLISSP